MSDSSLSAGMIEPELLVATCGPNGTILSRNVAWKRLLGNDRDLWSRLLPADSDIARQNFKEASGGSLVTHALFMVDRIDRDIAVPVLLNFIPVGTGDGSTRLSVAISGEILAEPTSWTEGQTQRHRMETLGRMTLGMTHDFNNLLSGILGHVELWRMEGTGKDTSDHLTTIEQAASDGAELIEKVQRYIRQEASSAFEKIDLTALVIDCISFTKPYWYNEPRRLGIDIKVVHTLGELPPIVGSPSELRDVLVNLILNAVHALPEGGQISFGGNSSGTTVELIVADTGTGMSSEVQKHIFEPLYSTKGDRGTGMGLAVAAGTMREHNGSISVTSELGVGTEFKLSFPTMPGESKFEEPEQVSDASTTSARVLIVDDEEMIRSVVSRLLAMRGHKTTVAASGREALKLLVPEAFDIVLTDQGMPEMSGRELAHQIRKIDQDIPIVLLTGDTDLRIDSALINRVMTKPFKIDEIEAVITSLI